MLNMYEDSTEPFHFRRVLEGWITVLENVQLSDPLDDTSVQFVVME